MTAAQEPLAGRIRQNRDRFLALALASSDLLLEADQDGKVLFAVGQAMAMAGKGARKIESGTLYDLFDSADRPKIEQAVRRMQEGRKVSRIALSIPLPAGRRSDVWLSGYRIEGEFEGHLFLAVETRPEIALPPPLPPPARQQAGLPGKEDFAGIAKARLNEATQSGLEYDLTLLDLPEVKSLAEKAGPEAAEAFRRDFAQFLQSRSVGGDSAGALGDTKFGVVHTGDLDEGALKSKIAELSGRLLPPGQSLGLKLATVDLDKADISEEEAAQALVYTINQFSRQEGSSVTMASLSEGVHSQLSQTVSEMSRLKAMINEGRFDLAYQPVVSLASKVVHHFECLARLKSGEEGGASPFRLVTFAEDTGLIGLLDKAIYERVIHLLYKNFMGDQAISLAVNLSGYSLSDPNFMQGLYTLLDHVPPFKARLLFEMTESSEVRDLAAVNGRLQELRKRGHPVCLDDFGAGSAAFHYLRALAVDFVKIDGSYVQNVLKQPKDIPFLKAIAQLCRDLKINMIAEMIEDAGTAELLKSLGVQFGQGYYFGRPGQTPDSGQKGGSPAGFVRKDGYLFWTGN